MTWYWRAAWHRAQETSNWCDSHLSVGLSGPKKSADTFNGYFRILFHIFTKLHNVNKLLFYLLSCNGENDLQLQLLTVLGFL